MAYSVADVVNALHQVAPPALAEDYDNVGLLIGQADWPVSGCLCTLDVTDLVLDEALSLGYNVIVAHHPLIFRGLKQLAGRNATERLVARAIKHDVAIVACHTNLDNVMEGVNGQWAKLLGLKDVRILAPKSGLLGNITVFGPSDKAAAMAQAMHQAGAGRVGNYTECGFESEGMGHFKPNALASPTIGQSGNHEVVPEVRWEMVYPRHLERQVVAAAKKSSGYEETAYFTTPVSNAWQEVGSGAIGQLIQPMTLEAFLTFLKERLGLVHLKYSPANRLVKKVALCGGTGSFLTRNALAQGADVFITADMKYHEWFEAEGRMSIVDVGHYESECHTKQLLHHLVIEKLPNIAAQQSTVDTNPVLYF